MASGIDVTLTLGYDGLRGPRARELHDYLTAPIGAPNQDGSVSSQHLDLVCGDETHPDGLPGSGQAGTIRIYAGLIRRGLSSDVVDYLRAAPWGGFEAIVVIHEENGPALVERLGYAPAKDWW